MTDFEQTVIDSLGRLETHMESLIGNGQPGRVGLLEKAVDDLKESKWKAHGVMLGVSLVISAIGALIHFLYKY